MFTSVSAPASTAHSSDSFCLSASGHLLGYWQKTDIVLCSCGKLISREPAESSPCSNRHVSCLGCDSEQRAASTNHHHATANRADAELVAKSIVQDFVYRHAFLSVLYICVLECTLSAGKVLSSPVPFSISCLIKHFWQLGHTTLQLESKDGSRVWF